VNIYILPCGIKLHLISPIAKLQTQTISLILPNDANFTLNKLSIYNNKYMHAYRHNFAFQKFATYKKVAKAGPTIQNGGYMV
jgi:hypothetical protein